MPLWSKMNGPCKPTKPTCELRSAQAPQKANGYTTTVARFLCTSRRSPLTPPVDPERFPDVRPDRVRYWLLRLLVLLLTVIGLAAIILGLAHGALAYYATKNGAELERAASALTLSASAVAGGFLLLIVSQISRVLIAIEENTRMLAFQVLSRQRDRGTEALGSRVPRQPRPPQ